METETIAILENFGYAYTILPVANDVHPQPDNEKRGGEVTTSGTLCLGVADPAADTLFCFEQKWRRRRGEDVDGSLLQGVKHTRPSAKLLARRVYNGDY